MQEAIARMSVSPENPHVGASDPATMSVERMASKSRTRGGGFRAAFHDGGSDVSSPMVAQSRWPQVRGAGNRKSAGHDLSYHRRRVMQVCSKDFPSRRAKPGHNAVPLLTYSVTPFTS